MKTNQRIDLLLAFDIVLNDVYCLHNYSDSKQTISEELYVEFLKAVRTAHVHNGWFTEQNVISALKGISSWLNEDSLHDWLKTYHIVEDNSKVVGLIMAGNIPLVGFHDFLAVFLSGNHPQMKLSSDDKIIWPIICRILVALDKQFENCFSIVEKLDGFHAIIATGSNNSANYFHSYFGKYPHIIRKNRTSIAILNGKESREDLKTLGTDIFSYFGLGCRNVTQLLVPKNYNLTPFFESIFSFKDIVNHHKYANNYDYNKAIYLLNAEDLLDNNFLLVRTSSDLNSPIGVLFKHEYNSDDELNSYIDKNRDKIQAIVGEGYIPFGESQKPQLTDYADGVDTMTFLTELV